MSKPFSRSKALGAKTMFAALQVLKERGGSLRTAEVIEEVGKRVKLDDWELGRYEATGGIRWQAIMAFFSIGYAKAGYLVKNKGVWHLTPEGQEALSLGETALMDATTEAYQRWNRARLIEEPTEDGGEAEIKETETALALEQIEAIASDGLKRFIAEKNPYEFQDLAAALLRGMGYYTPFVAPRGKDGGVDIVAYRDPLGSVSPRIKVQVKHRSASANVQEVRQLIGLLQKDGDVGIFISTSGFTPDALSAIRSSHVHVEMIDLDRFIALWEEFYSKLTDEDKTRLPLHTVYFIEPTT